MLHACFHPRKSQGTVRSCNCKHECRVYGSLSDRHKFRQVSEFGTAKDSHAFAGHHLLCPLLQAPLSTWTRAGYLELLTGHLALSLQLDQIKQPDLISLLTCHFIIVRENILACSLEDHSTFCNQILSRAESLLTRNRIKPHFEPQRD